MVKEPVGWGNVIQRAITGFLGGCIGGAMVGFVTSVLDRLIDGVFDGAIGASLDGALGRASAAAVRTAPLGGIVCAILGALGVRIGVSKKSDNPSSEGTLIDRAMTASCCSGPGSKPVQVPATFPST